MPRYKVKLIFKYSDVVHVEAEDEKAAIKEALGHCEEKYECFHSAKVEEE